MELAQSTYLMSEEPPFAYDSAKAALIQIPLNAILERVERLALSFDKPI
jgi:N-formylglutamate deformylase